MNRAPSEHRARILGVVPLPTVPELAAMIDHAVLKPTQTERDVVDACTLARHEHLASVCVKTSTGFGPEGATVEDVRLLRQVVGSKLGVKASGGIRSLDEALAMIEAGASRLGTSSTKAILDELRARRGEA